MKAAEHPSPPIGPTHPLLQPVLPTGLGHPGCGSYAGRVLARVYVVETGIPALLLDPGDLFFCIHNASSLRGLSSLRGSVRRLRRGEYPMLANRLESHFRPIATSWPSLVDLYSTSHDAGQLLTSYRQWVSRGRVWRDATSPYLIVRPWRSTVSAPISAISDEAAIFELLAQVGCGMPRSRRRHQD